MFNSFLLDERFSERFRVVSRPRLARVTRHGRVGLLIANRKADAVNATFVR